MPAENKAYSKTFNSKSDKQNKNRAKQQKKSIASLPLFERINVFLTGYLDKIFWITFVLTLLSGLLLFDIRISLSGDDSAYIIRAYDFIHHFTYPGFQGPLYPILLSPFIGIFGVKVVPLKLISLILMLGFNWLIYKSFKDRIPALLITSMLLLMAINSFFLYYASQTYSEALFIFLQALTFLVFFKYFLHNEDHTTALQIRNHIFLTLCILGLILTRTIGITAFIAIAGYFLLKKQWKNLLGFTVSFAVLLTLFEFIRYLVWKTPAIDFSTMVQGLMAKDYYNPAMGMVNLKEFFGRFFFNTNQYLSNFFYTIIGLHKSDPSFTGQPVVTVLTCAMLVASAIFSFRKNNYLFFTSLYTIVFLFSTFFIVNEYWGQYRFIIPCIPFAVLSLLTLFYFVLDMKQLAGIRWMFPVMICILFILSIKTLIPDIESARKIKNRYSGLTSDWEHYCRISEWTYSNLPKDALVACRKPSISFIYGHGKRFYGIMNVPSMSADSCLNNWQHNHLNYYLIQATSISNNPVSRDLYFAFKNSLVGYGFDNRELGTHDIKFYIMNFPDSIRARTLTELNRSGIEATSDYKVLKTILNEPGSKISIVYPDSLVLMLEKSKVTHILTANLQGYQTVERFMSYLEFKYPEIKTPVMQIGDNNDSPAFIYQLNYGVCKVK